MRLGASHSRAAQFLGRAERQLVEGEALSADFRDSHAGAISMTREAETASFGIPKSSNGV